MEGLGMRNVLRLTMKIQCEHKKGIITEQLENTGRYKESRTDYRLTPYITFIDHACLGDD